MEIEGSFAMWARPDTGSSPTSYPVPTWSAAKGIFESIAFFRDGSAWIKPVKVEICRAVDEGKISGQMRYQKYTTNYRGPLKEKNKVNFQLSALVMANVCYRLHGVVMKGTNQPLQHGNNPCHQLQAIFTRRLKKGQCHRTPCLGWSEFTASYWGPCRENDVGNIQTRVDVDISLNLTSVLHQVFDKPVNGSYKPNFQNDKSACIVEGVFRYD